MSNIVQRLQLRIFTKRNLSSSRKCHHLCCAQMSVLSTTWVVTSDSSWKLSLLFQLEPGQTRSTSTPRLRGQPWPGGWPWPHASWCSTSEPTILLRNSAGLSTSSRKCMLLAGSASRHTTTFWKVPGSFMKSWRMRGRGKPIVTGPLSKLILIFWFRYTCTLGCGSGSGTWSVLLSVFRSFLDPDPYLEYGSRSVFRIRIRIRIQNTDPVPYSKYRSGSVF